MKKFIIGYDVMMSGIYEIEAENEDEAMARFDAIDPRDLLAYASRETLTVLNEGVNDVREEKP